MKYPIFQLFSEHVRGERRMYWINRKDGYGKHWKPASDATPDKRKAQRDWERLMRAAFPTIGSSKVKWDGNTAANTGPENTFSLDKLMEAKRRIDALGPPPNVKFDLFGHELGDKAYELPALPEELCLPGCKDRRMLVVPRNQLERWAYELRRHGADVRVEPRFPEPQGDKP